MDQTAPDTTPRGSGVRLVPMPGERMPGWLDRAMADYVASRMRSGESREAAEANKRQSLDKWFPGGSPAAGHHVWELTLDDDTVVGQLWVGPFTAGSTEWWVFEIEVDAAHRRQGHARRGLELAHVIARDAGATSIGLNVFGYNTGARHLYEELGYEVASLQMRLPLT
ncbi:GNAT family N-acetyltransferase [Curtobacterium herbarum]|uniref:N-acetyltransferase domain-containing protein n=1 Tax=Curtobacterium herbarum TaxID=150122 RepID=A0ABP4KB31_9MICO|nr:GNAT family N-acetyltransferase [Curtobacterium herbarum]MBM7474771.1 ribosomal protein S18 acetylase RimI-like enzyme [Curtobacterium herbarum]MCS6545421.1 GNAT family N-acetyltransferase [Curtobacterium herbarum]